MDIDIDKDDQLSEGQEAINVAPGLEEDADIEKEIEMVGFDDFADDDLKQQHEEMKPNDDADNDFFDDYHSNNHLEIDDNNESVRALTLKDGINYDDDKYDEH